MSIGSILIGVACALVVVAYLARPFRSAAVGLDRVIETWVAEVRVEVQGGREAGEQRSRGAEEEVNYCPQCGRRVGPGDRFCAGCGTRLQKGTG